MFRISVSEELKSRCPDFCGMAIEARGLENTPYNAALWQEIDRFTQELRSTSTPDECKMQYAIAATRTAYRRCGKDPSRYRPSAEALRRRLLRGLDLYRIDTLVDLVNLASLVSGFSIGGFDADLIEGTDIVLGIGREGEPYEGIGRGPLNIDGLPVYRDAAGGIGTPTSDNERTKMSLGTTHTLMVVNGYSGTQGLRETIDQLDRLMADYAGRHSASVTYEF